MHADGILQLLEPQLSEHALRVTIELATIRPRQSGQAALMQGYGLWLGVLAALRIPRRVVTPKAWKKALSLGSNKLAAVERASEVFGAWPYGPKDHGAADAALIAWYGRVHIWKDESC